MHPRKTIAAIIFRQMRRPSINVNDKVEGNLKRTAHMQRSVQACSLSLHLPLVKMYTSRVKTMF